MNRLWVKLSLYFAVMVLLGTAVLGALGVILTRSYPYQFLVRQQLAAPEGVVELLQAHHQAYGSWDNVQPILEGANAATAVGGLAGNIALVLTDPQEVVLAPNSLNDVSWDILDRANRLPLTADDQVIGYLYAIPNRFSGVDHKTETVIEVAIRYLFIIAVVGSPAAILFGVLVSRYLTAPLDDLAGSAEQIARRDFSHRAKVIGSDEIQALAKAFNQMSEALAEAETLQRNMIADVAHELRTPLSVLQGNLRAMLDGVYPLTQAEIARLYDQTRLLNRLVADLHQLAQAEAGKLPLSLQPLDLNQLVAQTIAGFYPVAEDQQVALVLNPAPNKVTVNADAGRITQILNNLLANALRHTPAGGQITIATANRHNQAQLTVTDTGEGIPAADLPHLFDRFYRTDRARSRSTGGSGLGLAIVQAIVRQHHGEVSVTSKVGQGTTFNIHLPKS